MCTSTCTARGSRGWGQLWYNRARETGAGDSSGGSGFLTKVYSPVPKFVSDCSTIADGDRVAMQDGVRPLVGAAGTEAVTEFAVAMPEFEPTVVTLRRTPTAAMMMFGRLRPGVALPVLVAAAFVL